MSSRSLSSGARSERRRRAARTLLAWSVGGMVLCCWALAPARAQEAVSSGSATLPLSEVLRLHAGELSPAEAEPPPVPATLDEVELEGRLLSEGLQVRVHVEVSVLVPDQWVELPLLPVDEGCEVLSLPRGAGLAFRRHGGALRLLTRGVGPRSFDLELLLRAQTKGDERSLDLGLAQAARASLRLQYDEGLFRLAEGGWRRDGDQVQVSPSQGRFALRWTLRQPLVEPAELAQERPPIESLVTRGHGSLVSTLEGRQILRLHYELRFEGSKALRFELPAPWTLQAVYLNGAAQTATAADGALELTVQPRRAGEQAAEVELVLLRAQQVFHLSGALDVELPGLSWPVHEQFLELHLPEVFEYERVGGSMAQVDGVPEVRYSQDLPLPGTRLAFRQVLVTLSRPELRLRYRVGLDGQYFLRGDGGDVAAASDLRITPATPVFLGRH